MRPPPKNPVDRCPYRSCLSQSWLVRSATEAVLVRDDPANWTIFQLEISDAHVHPEDKEWLASQADSSDDDLN